MKFKKIIFVFLFLCITLFFTSCTDYKSQVEELQTNLAEMEEKISELESEIIDYKNQLKDANGTIAQYEATIDDLNEQLAEEESYTEVSNNNINESEYVYVTRTGSKYHQPWCSYLSNSCFSMTLDDALSAGYDACSRCY